MTALLFLPAITALVVAYGLVPFVARLAVRWGAIDMPSVRKVHAYPIPRLGGLSVIGAVGIAAVLDTLFWGELSTAPPELVKGVGFGLIPILCVSIIDDLRGVRPGVKLLAHVAGAGIAVWSGVSVGTEVRLFDQPLVIGVLAVPVSVLWMVGVTNAFNLIDGLDGLSAGLALIAAVSLAAVFALVGQPVMVCATLVLAGALAGFLPYNFYPARLFLGDAGATSIGFCLAVLALGRGSTLPGSFAVLVPVIIMGLPIADTLVTIARRGLRRLEHRRGGLFAADADHIHHRLLALGIDHRRAVLTLYGTGLLCAGVVFVSMFLNTRETALFAAALLLAGLVGIQRLGYDEFTVVRREVRAAGFGRSAVSRSMFAAFVDVVLVVVAAYAAVSVETDSWGLASVHQGAVELASVLAPLTVIAFYWAGLYRGPWRPAGLGDVVRLCGAISALALAGLLGYTALELDGYSPSLFLIYGLANLVLVLASRTAQHYALVTLQRQATSEREPALAHSSRFRHPDFPTPPDATRGQATAGGDIARLPAERDAA